jgi:hypothetical protein
MIRLEIKINLTKALKYLIMSQNIMIIQIHSNHKIKFCKLMAFKDFGINTKNKSKIFWIINKCQKVIG